jgi:D-glycero-alpha-D-manno-heptose 1-phosphate guanylyltransferase
VREFIVLKEAIILAGGFGTRLQSVISDVPKPLAPINDVPFLDYIFSYLKYYKIEKVILSVGYLSEKIMDRYKNNFSGIAIDYAIEKDPLGTGGGIRLAMEKCKNKTVLVLNGDSFFDADMSTFYEFHSAEKAGCSLALRTVPNAARYGTIKLDARNRITNFKEKDGLEKEGIINAGVYLMDREIYLKKTKEGVNFSIEKDFFESKVNELDFFGFEQQGYFIDIGIPEDYTKAQNEMSEIFRKYLKN